MNLTHIKLFVLTFEKGNFAAVAAQLNMAPSSVSRGVAQLESQLKVRLFQRNTRVLTPTQAGCDYYQQVVGLLAELEEIHNGLGEPQQALQGRLRVTASNAGGQILLPPVLDAFRRDYPEVKLELILADTQVDLIAEQIDIALRHGVLQDSSLIAKKLMSVHYQLVASPDYLGQAQAIVEPQDLLAHPLLCFAVSAFSQRWRFDLRQPSGAVTDGPCSQTLDIDPAFKITNAAVIKACALTGTGVALLPHWSIQTELQQGRLLPVLPHWQVRGDTDENAIWVVQPSRAYLPQKCAGFIAVLERHLRSD